MFENLKSFLYKVIFMILFIFLAKSCVSDYVNGGDENRISELQQMIDDNTTVTANLSNEYTETRIAGVIKLYKFDYNFNLNGKPYYGKININEVPNTNKLNIYYLSSDPNIVSHDPYESINNEKEKGNSISDLFVGIIWAILALIVLISLVSSLKKTKLPETKIDKKIAKTKQVIKEKKQPIEEISVEEKRLNEIKKEQIRKEKEDPTRFMPK